VVTAGAQKPARSGVSVFAIETAGATVGSLAGVAAGLGVVHLITEEASIRLGRVGGVLAFSGTHGPVTALGSRIGAAIRDR